MTRMSVAELTLKKQIERVQRDITTCVREVQAFELQRDILVRQCRALQDELTHLADTRLRASTKRKGPVNVQV